MAPLACIAKNKLLPLRKKEMRDPASKAVVSKPQSEPVDDKGNQDRAAKKRRQYMMYQRRHRARQNERARLLEDQVVQLKKEIDHLARMRTHAARHQHAVATVPIRGTHAGVPAQLVREYFRIFERGYTLADGEMQAQFMRSMMDVNVRGCQFDGADELFSQWQRYSQFFSSVHLSARQMDIELQDEMTVVTVTTTLALRQRRDSVAKLFPSLANCEGSLQDLLDTPLVVKSSLRFVFEANDRVSWFTSDMDFLGALASALGSFRKACVALDEALLDGSTGFIKLQTPEAKDKPQEATEASGRLDISFLLCDTVACF